jgi:hypothetical protein
MRILFLLCIIFFLNAIFADEYIEEKNLNLSTEGIEILNIDCGAGFLKVKGIDELKNIEVHAEIIIKRVDKDEAEEIIEKYIELSLEKKGENAFLKAGLDYSGSFFDRLFGESPQVLINLTVNIPKGMSLDVDDGSGFIDIRNVEGKVDLDDGSGETLMEYIKGNVYVEDGSGELELVEIQGNVEIDDGSGELVLKNITGDVSVDDGSGEIIVENIDGTIKIDDGSGSINIDGVSGDVIILEDGSGSVSTNNVSGKVVRSDD